MRTADTGAIIVLGNGRVSGITSATVETVEADASIEQTVRLMSTRAVRRLPVVRPAGPSAS